MRSRYSKVVRKRFEARLKAAFPTAQPQKVDMDGWRMWRIPLSSDMNWHVVLCIDTKHDTFGVMLAWSRAPDAPPPPTGVITSSGPLAPSEEPNEWVPLPSVSVALPERSPDEDLRLDYQWRLMPEESLEDMQRRFAALNFEEPEPPEGRAEACVDHAIRALFLSGAPFIQRVTGVEVTPRSVPPEIAIDPLVLPRTIVTPRLSPAEKLAAIRDLAAQTDVTVGALQSAIHELKTQSS